MAKQLISPDGLLDALPDIVLVIDGEGVIVGVHGAADRHGWSAKDWTGRSAFDLLHPDDVAFALLSLATLQTKAEGTPIELRVAHPVDGWRWFEVIGRAGPADTEPSVLVLACRDLTDRRRWDVAGGDGDRFRAVLAHSVAITLLVRPDGRIHSVSAAVTRLLGHDPEMLDGAPLATLAAAGFGPMIDEALAAASASLTSPEAVLRGGARVEVPVVPAGGGIARPFRFEIVDLCADPVVGGFVVSAHDVSDLYAAKEELRHLATHDALTDLPNRMLLRDRLVRALDARTAEAGVAVLFVDLDRFKAVNDLLGHEAGDELLVAFAERLLGVVGDGDVVVRLGGDEFVIIATGLRTRAEAERLAGRVEEAAAERFGLRNGVAHVTASVGLVFAGEEATAPLLLAEADYAMYQVKLARRQLTTPRTRQVTERRALAAELEGAIERGEIVPWFQPIISVADGHVLGFEALARWERACGEVVAPGGFFDVALEMGLSGAIDHAILEQACAWLGRSSEALSGVWVSVNLTASDLAEPGIVDRVTRALSSRGLEPSRLCIEVTERSMLEWPGQGQAVSPESSLRRLSKLGVRIALDDFGTGYSSLTHVRHFAPHMLKIDRSFVSGLVHDSSDKNLVAAVIGLAKALGMSTVAEGVDDQGQAEILQALGCDALQGYLFAPALPGDGVAAWVRNREQATAPVKAT